nr:UDP-glycosyltransferase 87A2-like [Tanacetum cinerariifolium]
MPSDESSYVSWLDSKICLKQSGVNFLWAARGGKYSRLSGVCGSNGDQLLNNKLILEDWESGCRLKNGSSIVKMEAITVVVRWFMYLESELVEKLTENAKRLGGICRESVEIGGRANKEIDCFIRVV